MNYFPPTVVIHYALGISRFQGVVYKAALIVLVVGINYSNRGLAHGCSGGSNVNARKDCQNGSSLVMAVAPTNRLAASFSPSWLRLVEAVIPIFYQSRTGRTTVVDHRSNIKDPRLSLKFGMVQH